MPNDRTEDHAYRQASAQMESIKAMVAALECDYERLEELRDAKAALEEGEELTADEAEELAELETAALAGESQACYACKDQDEARDRITEDPLSIELYGTWTLGDKPEADGFIILLCTGGPAVRIKGELGEHKRAAARVWLEYQDWGTPWTEYHGENMDYDALLTYCQQFYFGE